MNDFRCLEIWKVYGPGIKRLDLNKDKAPIDFNVWLKKIFEHRDKIFGKPEYPRVECNGTNTSYLFSLDEFAEAFFGAYSPNEIGAFFQRWLVQDTAQSEAFVQRVMDYEKIHKVVGIDFVNTSPIGRELTSSIARNFRILIPFNFPARELTKLKEDKSSFWYKREVFETKTDYYRSDLRGKKLRGVLPIRKGRGGFIKRYRIARENLLRADYTLYTFPLRDFFYDTPKNVEEIAELLKLDVNQGYFQEVYELRKQKPEKFKKLIEALGTEYTAEHLIKI